MEVVIYRDALGSNVIEGNVRDLEKLDVLM